MDKTTFLFPFERIDSSFCEKDGIKFRPLCIGDYEKGFCNVLKQLTSCDTDEQKFIEIFGGMYESNKIDPQYLIVVGEDMSNGNIAVAGTVLIEKKFIHGGHSVGHIEDIVVSKDYSGRGLGNHLITLLVKLGEKQGCYKVILDCTEDVMPFYQKCGFETKNLGMAIYF